MSNFTSLHHFPLLAGTFEIGEVRRILDQLLSDKISFHRGRQVRELLTCGCDHAPSLKRIEELLATRRELEAYLDEVEDELGPSARLQLDGDVRLGTVVDRGDSCSQREGAAHPAACTN